MNILSPTALAGKVALVTGGASGIGRATAFAFARAGAQVIVSDVTIAAGEATVAEARAAGGQGTFIRCDVSQAVAVAALVQGCVATYGRLDCAFNNAGVPGEVALTGDCSEDNWDQVMAVDLKGVWLCLKYELRQMAAQRSGAIVNMGSTAALVAARGLPAYTAAKGGVVALTRTAALEYARSGVRVNAVCPAGIYTPLLERSMDALLMLNATPPGAAQPPWTARLFARLGRWAPIRDLMFGQLHPLGRIGQPEDVAEAVVWLCSAAAAFVTGQAWALDGGLTMA